MKMMKKIMLSLLVAGAMGAASTSVFAESDAGRTVYKPADAVDMIKGKIQTTIEAINGGADGAKAEEMIKDVLSASKEVNANDRVDAARSKANNKLKSAKNHARENALQEASQELKEAEKMFEDLKKLF